MIRLLLTKVCGFLIVLGFLDFFVFLVSTLLFGGDAVNGKAEAGRYFLYGYHNGTKGYFEVSRRVFDCSRWLCYSVFVTWPLMLVANIVFGRIWKR